jgi:hypothetical protein
LSRVRNRVSWRTRRYEELVDLTLRVFKLRPERIRLTLQAQFFNVFNNTTFSLGRRLSPSPSTFGYYNGADTNSRRTGLTGHLTWSAFLLWTATGEGRGRNLSPAFVFVFSDPF